VFIKIVQLSVDAVCSCGTDIKGGKFLNLLGGYTVGNSAHNGRTTIDFLPENINNNNSLNDLGCLLTRWASIG
jgi:hypothetical protein